MTVSAQKDYYKVLGVAKSVKMTDLKKAYRDLAKKHHPDANSGSKKAEENFKKISEAYTILSNAKKRKQYDRMRTERARPQRSSGRGRSNWGGDAQDYARQYTRQGPRDDFRGTQNRTGFEEDPQIDPDFPTQGFDLQFLIDVPFAVAALGGTLPFSYEKYVTCPDCTGTGVNADQDACLQCGGNQRVVENVNMDVTIPHGVADDYTLRIPGAGAAGRNGGPPGDLMLKVSIDPHPRFRRVKLDVYADVTIPRELAEQGGPLEVETLDGVKTIQVEEDTLTGEEHRISGAGWRERVSKTKRGDFVVKFHIAHS